MGRVRRWLRMTKKKKKSFCYFGEHRNKIWLIYNPSSTCLGRLGRKVIGIGFWSPSLVVKREKNKLDNFGGNDELAETPRLFIETKDSVSIDGWVINGLNMSSWQPSKSGVISMLATLPAWWF
jgi:hypothetical protein